MTELATPQRAAATLKCLQAETAAELDALLAEPILLVTEQDLV